MSAVAKQTEVRERPILFSGAMVKAILEGRKTQARRVITPQPPHERGIGLVNAAYCGRPEEWLCDGNVQRCRELIGVTQWKCPYGWVGDRLWVRETWRLGETNINGLTVAKYSIMDGPDQWMVPSAESLSKIKDRQNVKNRPSIFMPRWASRITLEITNIRVERLQDISEADAIAEGLDQNLCAEVFDRAAGKDRASECYWLTDEETGDEYNDDQNLCHECALKTQKRLGKKWMLCGDGGSAMESDGPAMCGECGTALVMSLTEYGIERELRIEDDPQGKEPQYFPVRGSEARIVHTIADGIGDLRNEHWGRLAQIGFATGWNQINGKRKGCAWSDNPWVWILEFRKL